MRSRSATPTRQRSSMVQRRRACSRRKAGRSAPASGRQTGSGRSSTPDPLVVAAVAAVDVGRRRVVGRSEQHQLRPRRVDGPGRRGRGHRARAAPCAGGRPGPPSWARRARGAAIDGGSGRWSPTPWRSPNRRQALGASTATQRSTTRTSRITIVTPRRPTFALRKNPNERAFTSGGWWGNATAPTSSALLLSTSVVPSAPRRIKALLAALLIGRRAVRRRGSTTARRYSRP